MQLGIVRIVLAFTCPACANYPGWQHLVPLALASDVMRAIASVYQRLRRIPAKALLAVASLVSLSVLCLAIGRTASSPGKVERGNNAEQRTAAITVDPEFHTFSICAIDPVAGQCGVAVTSRVTQVGRYVPFVRAGVGAVATQAMTAVKYGNEGLELLAAGKTPAEAVQELLKDDANRELRQLGLIDMQGRTAAFTGKENSAYAGSRQGKNFTVQGNLLVGPQVILAVADSFAASEGGDRALADRLIAALEAGQAVGGDKRLGRPQSAALVVADVRHGGIAGDHIVETLQVAEHPEPVGELRRQYDVIHERLGYREFAIVRGRDIVELKRMLHRLKLLWPDREEFPSRAEMPSLPDFDPETAAAVDRFRQQHQLPVPEDGLGHAAGLVDQNFVTALRAEYKTAMEGAKPAATLTSP
jgi:uncharacterized Ntn-hydrolase superfamily protein